MRRALVLTALCGLAAGCGCADKAGQSLAIDPPLEINNGVAPEKSARPRIVLDSETISALKAAATAKTPAFETLLERCRVYSTEKSAGYLGLQWSEAVVSLALCWHATGDETYADIGVRYLGALLDDRERIGDGRGGDEEVRRNSGYPIRAHGVGAALGYDWFYTAKAMTPALRARIASRLGAWLDWYGKEGYLRESPFANYFWGYMSALSLAGLALEGDVPAAAGWLAKATKLLDSVVIPGFGKELRGGDWAEGWQYGPLVAVSLAMIVRGFATARGVDYRPKLPWFSELVSSQLHRLHPSRETSYSNGTHRIKPALPSSTPLEAAIFALAESDPQTAAKARYIERKILPPMRPTYAWFALLAALGSGDEIDPLEGEPLSMHLAGPGTTFARSSWAKTAVWTSFQAGAKIAVDHQHNDQGHFELWRGSDALLIDGGDTEAFATINHNTLLIDDAGRALNYPPNQGVWAANSKTTGFSDDGALVVAIGDLTGAWDPKCAERGCSERAVKEVTRTFIYLRPNVVVVDDRVETGSVSDRVTWVAHASAEPVIAGNRAVVMVGGSRADLTVFAPAAASLRAPKEPTTSETHVYRRNLPKGDVWRIEVPTLSKETARHFRVFMLAANRGAEVEAPAEIPGTGADAIVGSNGERPIAVVFARSTAGGAVQVRPASLVGVTGLAPGQRYAIKSSLGGARGKLGAGTCQLVISGAKDGRHAASDAGAISVELGERCDLVR